MIINVKRKIYGDNYTIGEMYINDNYLCDTLEDVVRDDGVKVQDQTAIPAGTYQLILDMSTRFGKIMPHILNVPDFQGIRIHCGNSSKDTSGCILVGTYNGQADYIKDSTVAYNVLMDILGRATKRTEKIMITIEN